MALNGQAPSYIKDLLKYKNSDRVLRSSNNHFLDEHVANLKSFGDRAYSVAAPKLWNKLPLDIRLSLSVTVFIVSKRIMGLDEYRNLFNIIHLRWPTGNAHCRTSSEIRRILLFWYCRTSPGNKAIFGNSTTNYNSANRTLSTKTIFGNQTK